MYWRLLDEKETDAVGGLAMDEQGDYSMKTRLIIIGARALGREICNYARDVGFEIVGFLDDKIDALDGFEGYPPILGSVEDWIVKEGDQFVCAVGDSRMRARYSRIIEGKGGRFSDVVHPTAYVGPNVKMGDGCVVCPFAVVDCDLTMGRHVIVNVHSLVAHDCKLGDCVTLSPNVHLGGRTVIRREAFLGIGVSTVPGVEIGEEALIAAGSCVTRDIPERVMAAGIPALVKKTLKD